MATFIAIAVSTLLSISSGVFSENVDAQITTDDTSVSSPDGSLVVTVTSGDEGLGYSVTRNGTELVSNSPISIRDTVAHTVNGEFRSSHDSTWTPTWGQFSSVRDHHNRLTLDLDVGGTLFSLVFQVYNDGLGFRFRADGQESLPGTVANFNVRYNMKNGYMAYWPGGEGSPNGPVAVESLTSNPTVPLLVDAGSDGFFALLESDLYFAENFGTISFRRVSGEAAVVSNVDSETIEPGSFITPWRVILVGDTPGDLLESTVTVNLAAPLELADASWIDPGKVLWNWRITGYRTDDSTFTYQLNTESIQRMIDFASDNGLEYVLIDDDWYLLIENGQLVTQASGFDIYTVVAYAHNKNVKIMLYFDRRPENRVVNTTDEQLFALYSSLGVSGVKYGFRGNNVPFTREALHLAAAHQLFVDFHDSPVPLTGARRTIPNVFTREVGWAQQDARRAFEPTDFIEMAMINSLTGPFDQTNGVYDLHDVTSRQKGPRNQLHSTVAGENARTLIIFSGLAVFPDAPEEYEKKAEMFEFLRESPTTWDETRILHSSIPEYITTARRSGSAWFVCSATNESARTLDIPLDFLDLGSYQVTYYEDDHDGATPTHYINNRETYQVRTGTVTSADTVSAVMVEGGGHCMWIRKQPVTLALTPNSIGENGGVSTVTATLSHSVSEVTTLTVSSVSRAAEDFSQSGTELTIAAGATESTGMVTIKAIDNDVDAPDKEVMVSACLNSSGTDVAAPDTLTLIITDDDEAAPRSRWPMEGDADDVVGTFDGTLSGGAVFDTSDPIEGTAALSLGGTDEAVDLSTHLAGFPLGGSARTIAGWFNPSDGTHQHQSFFTYGQRVTGQRFSVTADRTAVSVAVGGHNWGVDSLSLSDDWHHVAATYEAGGASDSIKIYLDGVLQTSATLAGSPQAMNTTAGVAAFARIGRSDDNRYYAGSIDDVRLYDVALTAEEVVALHDGLSTADETAPISSGTVISLLASER